MLQKMSDRYGIQVGVHLLNGAELDTPSDRLQLRNDGVLRRESWSKYTKTKPARIKNYDFTVFIKKDNLN